MHIILYNKYNKYRDDRCIADNGREAWYPFLDEHVVQFLQSIPLEYIVNMMKPPGEGDKMILREIALTFGLKSSTNLVKRAIQFGTRIAKLSNIMYIGSNRKGKGNIKIQGK